MLAGALNVALDLGAGPPPAQLLVASAVLALLELAAKEQPLLLVIDDLPWLDRASALVLGMVARRLTGLPVGLLAACRTGEPNFFEQGNLPVARVAPLSDQAATELLAEPLSGADGAGAAAAARHRRGNPLALLELPVSLGDLAQAVAGTLPAALPAQPPAAARLRRPGPGAARLGLRPAAAGRPRRHRRSAPDPGAGGRPRRGEPGRGRAVRPGAGRRDDRTADLPAPAHPVGDRGTVDQLPAPPRPRRARRPAGRPARAIRLAPGRGHRRARTNGSPRCCRRSRTATCGAATRSARSPSCCARPSSARPGRTAAGGWPRPPTWARS